jgi:hypothetical protein
MEWAIPKRRTVRLIEPVDAGTLAGGSERDRQALAYTRFAASAIANVTTRMCLLETGEHLLPVSINNGGEGPDNSYVVSPLTTYVGYAEYEIGRLGRPWLTAPLRRLVRVLGSCLETARVDRIVQVNNWLLSTNLYPANWDGVDLPDITRLLVETYPDHAIGFRSLNRYCNAKLIARMEALGYLTIPSRQVYLFDGHDGPESAYLHRRDSRNDGRLLTHSGYEQVPGAALADADYPYLEQLYNALYLDKYCRLNPQFTANWLRAGQRDGWLKLIALRSPAGRFDAVLGWIANEGILTTPVVGYDTKLPQKLGLYRLISQITLEEAARRRCMLNMSAGAAHFKRMRGGQPEIEFSLVQVSHLPRQRQRMWRILGRLLHSVAVPVMKGLAL